MEEIILEVWGDFACFSDPAGGKVERLSYPFPTPSAVRGILSAIYSKPPEFFWQINRIEVLNPIRYISFKRNEIKSTVRDKPIYTDEDRTQRQTVALRDVRYRIAATIVPRETFSGTAEQLCRQALRRIRNGKTYFQPSLGLREFVAYFEESDGIKEPIPVDMDAGLMVYDVFDLHDYEVRKKTRPQLSLFHAVMKQGVIQVPPYDSPEVLKGGSPC
ncbi:type I-C CRISPR-associated protein Cas5c [Flintibacter muris]|uniref:type I-C CRISPR-associated protein Cas5c n=1 Tax=Flintibacter muris TaxID=2941327 RepID=UPI00136A63DF|nr:type I-C CRISPR-associated protein Cas5c [Flintibacter muris]